MQEHQDTKIVVTDSLGNTMCLKVNCDAQIFEYEDVFKRILLFLEYHPKNVKEFFPEEE